MTDTIILASIDHKQIGKWDIVRNTKTRKVNAVSADGRTVRSLKAAEIAEITANWEAHS
jgi:hypothetical protein